MGHGRVMCSCGRTISSCRCLESHNVIRTEQHPACGQGPLEPKKPTPPPVPPEDKGDYAAALATQNASNLASLIMLEDAHAALRAEMDGATAMLADVANRITIWDTSLALNGAAAIPPTRTEMRMVAAQIRAALAQHTEEQP